MSKTFYQKLRSPPVLSDHVILSGIGKSILVSQFCYTVPIEIGQIEDKWNFVVAGISDSVLLGLDFLEHYKITINSQDFSTPIWEDKNIN